MPASSSTESAPNGQPDTPNLLGRLLGLPLDADVGKTNATAPEIMKGLYECWSSTGAPQSCLVEGEPLEDVNTVRSFVGTSKFHCNNHYLFKYQCKPFTATSIISPVLHPAVLV